MRGAVQGRIVICDLPPLLSTDDALAFSPMADALLMVVSESKTSRDSLTRAWELIDGLELLGLVLNRSRENTLDTYYGY